MRPVSYVEEQSRSDRNEECGVGRCRPNLLQVFATVQWFVGIYSIAGLLSSTMSSFVNSQVPMLERQFGFSSSQSGLLMSCNDIGFLCSALFSGYIARKVHIPRGLGVSTLMYGVCGFICALPYFIQDQSTYDIDTVASTSNDSRASFRSKIPMCFTGIYGNSSTGVSNETNSCSDVSNATAEDVAKLTYKKVAFTLIAAGMVLQGAAKSVRSPFLTLYVDDGADKRKTGFYLGIVTGTAIFGPALAYFLGGYFSKMYVTLKAVDISPRDPRWIGAWWLGFIVFGTISILVSMPLCCFPRRLRNPSVNIATKGVVKEHLVSNKKHLGLSLLYEGKVFLSSVLRVLRNPVFAITTASGCFNLVAVAGILAFLPKYISAQYSVPLWQANMLMAGSSIMAYSVGSFCSGFMSRRVKMTPQNCFLVLIIFTVICLMLFACGLFLGCEEPILLKDLTSGAPSGVNTSHPATCARECTCGDQYFPVCGAGGQTYYSPCQAGCTQQSAMTFSNCTCIPGGMAESGLCDQGCSTRLYIFAATTFASCLAEAFKLVPSIIIHIRCVEERDRAVATATSGFLVSTLGLMPGPVIFGRIVDGACSLWRYTCGERQDCQLYDIVYFRKALHVYGISLKIIPLCMVTGLYIYFRVKKVNAWRVNNADNELMKSEEKETLNNGT